MPIAIIFAFTAIYAAGYARRYFILCASFQLRQFAFAATPHCCHAAMLSLIRFSLPRHYAIIFRHDIIFTRRWLRRLITPPPPMPERAMLFAAPPCAAPHAAAAFATGCLRVAAMFCRRAAVFTLSPPPADVSPSPPLIFIDATPFHFAVFTPRRLIAAAGWLAAADYFSSSPTFQPAARRRRELHC
jgi:hypothetical protein